MKAPIMVIALVFSGMAVAGEEGAFRQVNEFKDKSGASLGRMEVRYIADEVFDSMRIVQGTAVLYRIEKSSFYSKDELEEEVFDKSFYGYNVVDLADDYVMLSYLRNKGKSASDDIRIQWNEASKTFHIRPIE
jgi:hypothetical protein